MYVPDSPTENKTFVFYRATLTFTGYILHLTPTCRLPEFRAKQTKGPLKRSTRMSKHRKMEKTSFTAALSKHWAVLQNFIYPSSLYTCASSSTLKMGYFSVKTTLPISQLQRFNRVYLPKPQEPGTPELTGQANCAGTCTVRPPDFSLPSPDPFYQHSCS